MDPENQHLNRHCRENLRSHMNVSFVIAGGSASLNKLRINSNPRLASMARHSTGFCAPFKQSHTVFKLHVFLQVRFFGKLSDNTCWDLVHVGCPSLSGLETQKHPAEKWSVSNYRTASNNLLFCAVRQPPVRQVLLQNLNISCKILSRVPLRAMTVSTNFRHINVACS
jgi:hypothetical protein